MSAALAPLWWLSWNQRPDANPERAYPCAPAAWPPPEPVLGYWITGGAFDGSYTTLVALVRAETAEIAKALVEAEWSPGVERWRFCRERLVDDAPGDRFPPPAWAIASGRWPWAGKVAA